MKFKTNGWGERELHHTDIDGDTFEVHIKIRTKKTRWPVMFTTGHGENRVASSMTRKQARQLANKLLKELDR